MRPRTADHGKRIGWDLHAHVYHASGPHNHVTGNQLADAFVELRLLRAVEIAEVVTHLIHHVVKHVKMDGPIAGIDGAGLYARASGGTMTVVSGHLPVSGMPVHIRDVVGRRYARFELGKADPSGDRLGGALVIAREHLDLYPPACDDQSSGPRDHARCMGEEPNPIASVIAL
jgi:hypothetical protein